MKGLTLLAECRQAQVTEATLSFYSARLAQEDFCAVEKAFATVGERARAEGETAFPSLGTLLIEVKRAAPALVLNNGQWVSEGSPDAEGWTLMRGDR